MLVNNYGAAGNGLGFGVGVATRNYIACNVLIPSGGKGLVMRGDSQLVDNNNYVTTNSGDRDYITYLDGPTVNQKHMKTLTAEESSGVLLLSSHQEIVNYNDAVDISDFQPYSFNGFTGEVTNIVITNGGTGYTAGSTTVTVSGDGDDTGLNTDVFVNNGVVESVRIYNGGSSYTAATVAFTGSGTGAVGTVKIGKNKATLGEKHTVRFNQAVTVTGGFQAPAGTLPLSVPAQGAITFEERFNNFTFVSKNF